MTTVRAKFLCYSVKTTALYLQNNLAEVVLHPVFDDGNDNAAWSKATPQGKLEMSVTVPEAAAFFVPGGEYFLDFTPVADIELGTIDGVTAVDTEAEVAQPGGPAEAWAARAAQSPPAYTIVVPSAPTPTAKDPAPEGPIDTAADSQAAPPAPKPDAAPAAAANRGRATCRRT